MPLDEDVDLGQTGHITDHETIHATLNGLSAAYGAFIGCRLTASNLDSISSATETVVPFNGETLDTDAFHDTATSNERITIPAGKGGTYRVWGRIQFVSNSSGFRSLYVKKNGSIYLVDKQTGAAPVNDTNLEFSDVFALAAGDYIHMACYQNSGSTLTIRGEAQGGGVRTFGVERIGD